MKNALTHALFFLFEICVFGDADKAETVSVIEGKSVTLHTGVTEIQRDDVIEWRLNGNRIARISGDSSSSDGVFRGRLKLDKQTGDIKITNIKFTDSGEYKLKITTSNRGSSVKIFSVSAVTDPRSDGVTVVAVMEGDSVVLHTDTEILRDDEILWRFRGEYVIAKIKKDEHIYSTYDIADGIFRHRLHLNHHTGHLIISDIRSKTSGLYEVDVKRSTHTIHKSFNVTITGVFGDADKAETVSVIEGKSVTLHTGVTEIQRDDVIEWRLNGYHIAKISGDPSRTDPYRDRMKLDHQTGDLKITNIKTTDSGEYVLNFTSNRGSSVKIFSVSAVKDPRFDGVTVVAVTEGDSVVLHTDTEMLKDDEILWRFRGEYVIAKMGKDEHFFSINGGIADGIFRDRLHLDHHTGNLTISDITSNTSGLYEVDVKRSTHTIHKSFSVTITDRLNRLSVKAGVPVTLVSGVTELYRDDLVRWRFEHGDVLAEINKTAGVFSTYDDVPDGRFRGRLKLIKQTGSLNITHTKTSDSGLYHLDIIGYRHTIFRKFDLSVCDVTLIGPPFGVGVGAGAAVVLGVLLVAAAACVIYYRHRGFKLVTRKVLKSRSEVEVMNNPQV